MLKILFKKMKKTGFLLIFAIFLFSTAYSQDNFVWKKQLKIKNNFNSEFDKLRFGIDERASDGVDEELGEDYDLPGFPPGDELHAFFFIHDAAKDETTKSYIDLRPLKDSAYFYVCYTFETNRIQFQERTFEWDILGSLVDSAYLSDGLTGDLFKEDMKSKHSFVLDNEYINRFSIHIWFRNPNYVSVAESPAEESPTIYPNPCFDYATINNFEDYHHLVVYNELGEELFSRELGIGENKLYFGNLHKGLYFVKLETANSKKIEYFKIIKN